MENYGVEPKLTCFYLADTIVLAFERLGEACSRCLCIDRLTFKIVNTSQHLDIKITERKNHQIVIEFARNQNY
jgi:hypothetical protein